MDIKQAKEEIRRTVLAYTARTEAGTLKIPSAHQRPMLLLGPPGVGKTAILSQLAREMGIGLVAYTMTHHTRQSALGLPVIREKTYGDKIYRATEYTMSEIIASVYDQMEQTGKKEGILFLDEINCVSETLLPAMLQLLQNKQFGVHPLPEGWVIVGAGNPSRYNQSARSFDTVTLDRVRLLDITESFPVWLEYAAGHGVHPAVLSYLQLNPEHFYWVEPRTQGRSFVTARGWEDLSVVLHTYESMGFPVEDLFFGEYLQNEVIAAAFSAYYRLFEAFRDRLDWTQILSGHQAAGAEDLRQLPFDQRLTVVEILLHTLMGQLDQWQRERSFSTSVGSFVGSLGSPLKEQAHNRLAQRKNALEIRKSCGVLGAGEEEIEGLFFRRMEAALREHPGEQEEVLEYRLRSWAETLQSEMAIRERQLYIQMENAMGFVQNSFGADQELLIFLTQLGANPAAMRILRTGGEEKYQRLLDEVLPERLAARLR